MIIHSFLPNPAGKDTEGEWLLLLNNGTEAVSLRNWKIEDASGKRYVIREAVLQPGEELQLEYSATKLSLNNNGETLKLFNDSNTLVHEISYAGAAAEDRVYSHEGVVLSDEEVSAMLEASVFSGSITYGASPPIGEVNFTRGFISTMIFTAFICASLALYVIQELQRN